MKAAAEKAAAAEKSAAEKNGAEKAASNTTPEEKAEVAVNTVANRMITESEETASTSTTSSIRRLKISKTPAALPCSLIIQETVTLCPFCYHKGGVHEFMDACHCTTGEDPCDCCCACDEKQMAQKAVCFPGSIFWSVKPPEERRRLLAKAARWD